MKFICAGLAKTGTKSIAKALTVLGFKVYDFYDQLLHHGDEWYDLYYNDQVPNFYAMFKDVDVVIDFPANFFFEELVQAFPDAKVILSERDEESWAKSLKNLLEIFHNSFLTRIRHFVPTYNRYYLIGLAQLNAFLGTADPNASYIYRKRYNWHNDRVKAVIPKDKLLVYRVVQGWQPLCMFTDRDVPDVPFPHTNINNSILETFQSETEYGRRIAGEARFAMVCLSCLLVVVLAVMIFYYFNRIN